MGSLRPHWSGLYQPAMADLMKIASNEIPAILQTVENALDAGNTRTLTNVDNGGWLKTVATGDGGFIFQDEAGARYALGFGRDGQFDDTTRWALVNKLHYYIGPEEPVVYQGNWVIWQPTDGAGTPVGSAQIGRN